MEKDEVMVAVEKDGVIYSIPFSYAAFAGFERRHGVGSVERMMSMLASDCNSFADVGAAMNLSRERVRQWYMKHLARHFPQRNGRARKRICAVVRPRRKTFPDYMRRLWHEARKRHIPVAQANHIYADGKVSAPATVIFLGDVLTSVYSLKNRHSCIGGYVTYAATMVTKRSVQTFPLHCFIVSADSNFVENCFFVKQEVLAVYLGARLAATVNLPLNEGKLGYVNVSRFKVGVDWREFRGEKGWEIVQGLCAQTPDP